MTKDNQNGHWKKWIEKQEQDRKEEISIPVILHIGMEKTGSKALQTWLSKNRRELAEEGWYIPSKLGAINHRQVSFLGYDENRRDDGTANRNIMTNKDLKVYKSEVFKRLKQEVKTAIRLKQKAIVVSTELASSRLTRNREIRRLIITMKKAGCNPILVTLFRRDPVDLLESRYSTAVMHEGWAQWNPARAGSREANLFGDQIKLQTRWSKTIRKLDRVDFDVYTYSKENLIRNSTAATVANFMGCKKEAIDNAASLRTNEPLPLLNIRLLVIDNKIKQMKFLRKGKISRGLRDYALKNKLGRWRYRLPKRLRRKYSELYVESKIGNQTRWLIWSSWHRDKHK